MIVCIGFVLACSSAESQENIHIVGPGGRLGTLLRTRILPQFYGAQGANYTYEAIDDEKLVEILMATPTSQIGDVIISSQQGIDIAITNGGCVEIEDSESYGDLYGFAKFGSLGVGIGLETSVIAYSPLSFNRNKWPVPARWSDLLSSAVPRKVYLPSDFRRVSVHTLLMLARATDGSKFDVEQALQDIADAHPSTFDGLSSSELGEKIAKGMIDVTVMTSSDAYDLKQRGVQIDYAYPEGGLAAEVIAGCVSRGRTRSVASQSLLRHLISVPIQIEIASLGYGPTNHDAEIEKDLARQIPYGRARVASMVPMNWVEIRQSSAAWGSKWSKILSGR